MYFTCIILFNLLNLSNKYSYYSHLSDGETDFAQYALNLCEIWLNFLSADSK